jgi:DNA polymerase elongation subunit (family B)
MSYVDAHFSPERDMLYVVERVNGKRVFKEFPVNYTAYYEDHNGRQDTIFSTKATKVTHRSKKKFNRELKLHSRKRIYEADMNWTFRTLENNYLDAEVPELNVCFFDIEVDFMPEKGFAPVTDPFASITAISVYLQWVDSLITLALIPPTLNVAEATKLAEEFENTWLYESEDELLKTFLDLIDDADVLSGWNSEGFDIPYIVNRVTLVLGKQYTRKLCLWDLYPKPRTFIRYGNEQESFDIIGRLHLDYLELYRKYTYHEMHSYALDAIGEYEVGEHKIAYEGSIDDLYKNDFRKFVEYNRQDTMLLVKIDDKNKFIDLANVIAHANTVLLPTTMGAVAVTDQAIVNEAHKQGVVVPNRKPRKAEVERDDYSMLETKTAVGAYVAYPKKGMHEFIGGIDINSLYPSVIRAMNMGPETIVGQLEPDYTNVYINEKLQTKGASLADAWEGLFSTIEYQKVIEKNKSDKITVRYENGKTDVMTGAEIYNLIFKKMPMWCLSANGTIFDQSKRGIIPGLLERWDAERKQLQTNMREAKDEKETAFWDRRQLVKKINLNSLYGAILNPGSRFFDIRIGQSVTLTGRSITRHMGSKTNEIITGTYDYKGDSIIYGDTDSVYFTAFPSLTKEIKNGEVDWNNESAIVLYDQIADAVNDSFPEYMRESHNVLEERGVIIKAGRELVASKGIFITKKRYAVLIYDLEGNRLDVNGYTGKVKAMGLDLKRSDTPKFMQEFLNEILKSLLEGSTKDEIFSRIKQFRILFKERPGWEKGTPKRVNNLTKFWQAEHPYDKLIGKRVYKRANMPGHVRAALNWNTLKDMNSDRYSMPIVDGAKTIVCKLRPNPMGFTSVGYPIDENHLPEWFKELPFDHDGMQSTIIDSKLSNLLGVLNWDLQETQQSVLFESLFELE